MYYDADDAVQALLTFVIISMHTSLVATRKIEGNNIVFHVSNVQFVPKTDSYYIWANWPLLYCGYGANQTRCYYYPRSQALVGRAWE